MRATRYPLGNSCKLFDKVGEEATECDIAAEEEAGSQYSWCKDLNEAMVKYIWPLRMIDLADSACRLIREKARRTTFLGNLEQGCPFEAC